MRIIDHYPTRESLNKIEEPYRGALLLLEDLYLNPPLENRPEIKVLSCYTFINFVVMSAVRTICDHLKENLIAFPSTLLFLKNNMYFRTSDDSSMKFESFYVNNKVRLTVLLGLVYYILSRDPDIGQNHLHYIEKVAVMDDVTKVYFEYFKSRCGKDETAKTTVGDDAQLLAEVARLKDELKEARQTIEGLTGDPAYKAEKHLTILHLAAFVYLLSSYKKKVSVLGNKSGWARILSRLTTRGAQGLREGFGSILKDMGTDKLQPVFTVLADEVAPLDADFAQFIRNQVG